VFLHYCAITTKVIRSNKTFIVGSLEDADAVFHGITVHGILNNLQIQVGKQFQQLFICLKSMKTLKVGRKRDKPLCFFYFIFLSFSNLN